MDDLAKRTKIIKLFQIDMIVELIVQITKEQKIHKTNDNFTKHVNLQLFHIVKMQLEKFIYLENTKSGDEMLAICVSTPIISFCFLGFLSHNQMSTIKLL